MYIELYLKSKVGMDSEVLGVKVPLAFLGTGASRYVPRDVIVFPNFPAVFCFFNIGFTFKVVHLKRPVSYQLEPSMDLACYS